ncbi:hypothetical protein C0214_10970 [Methylobacterium sp. DM1]|uniref:Uncharacterized protein n=1 Tax=Methylorubrum populi (strain ATCC BAA-705 / NCIMB 13946 / BJ001) TaxID=441620 RepID=B1ZJD0_METPB|nr:MULTISPECIES: hypothetical protein [Methylorubrum]ACB80035.1 hypothetical protein Mpop_1872 [Methylorubrum populi BJ001]AWI88727.1 hypothetical protein C0214_10970 [Methylobacterium sp. DM1]MBI1691956.1 hypothetical protein [Methylorubrum sp. DB1722]
MRRLLLLAAPLPLAACHQERPSLSIPASLLRCSPRPVPPAGGTQRDVAGYVVDLDAAHGDCHGKLGRVRGLVEGAR